MCAAECGQEIVERHFVGYVDRRKSQTPLVSIAVKNIVVTDGNVEQISWRDSRRIVVVIFHARSGNGDER